MRPGSARVAREGGFTLVELLVAAAVIALVALGGAQLMTVMQGASQGSADLLAFKELAHEAASRMSTHADCLGALSGQRVRTAGTEAERKADPAPPEVSILLGTNRSIRRTEAIQANVRIESVTLRLGAETEPLIDRPGTRSYLGELSIRGSTVRGPRRLALPPYVIPLKVAARPDSPLTPILSCYTGLSSRNLGSSIVRSVDPAAAGKALRLRVRDLSIASHPGQIAGIVCPKGSALVAASASLEGLPGAQWFYPTVVDHCLGLGPAGGAENCDMAGQVRLFSGNDPSRGQAEILFGTGEPAQPRGCAVRGGVHLGARCQIRCMVMTTADEIIDP